MNENTLSSCYSFLPNKPVNQSDIPSIKCVDKYYFKLLQYEVIPNLPRRLRRVKRISKLFFLGNVTKAPWVDESES